MAAHDIIDNRTSKLVDSIAQMLGGTDAARFAVGYFFVSGLECIAKSLAHVKELRLLIGNTSNRETIEQFAEGHRRLELVDAELEAAAYPKRSAKERMAEGTAFNVRESLELMDQTDSIEETVKVLVRIDRREAAEGEGLHQGTDAREGVYLHLWRLLQLAWRAGNESTRRVSLLLAPQT